MLTCSHQQTSADPDGAGHIVAFGGGLALCLVGMPAVVFFKKEKKVFWRALPVSGAGMGPISLGQHVWSIPAYQWAHAPGVSAVRFCVGWWGRSLVQILAWPRSLQRSPTPWLTSCVSAFEFLPAHILECIFYFIVLFLARISERCVRVCVCVHVWIANRMYRV